VTPARHDALEHVLRRAADGGTFDAWSDRGRTARWCTNPIRLLGSSRVIHSGTGEIQGTFSSAELPDGVLLKACGQRRATVCPPCSAIYKGDAWQLVVAGLRGGKGVPESVAGHPAVFLTLTAPSFGTVHSTRELGGTARPCRPGGPETCVHGRPAACESVHEAQDPHLGEPLCEDCFDYPGAVLWNATVPELWRRTTIGIWRSLALQIGFSRTALARKG